MPRRSVDESLETLLRQKIQILRGDFYNSSECGERTELWEFTRRWFSSRNLRALSSSLVLLGSGFCFRDFVVVTDWSFNYLRVETFILLFLSLSLSFRRKNRTNAASAPSPSPRPAICALTCTCTADRGRSSAKSAHEASASRRTSRIISSSTPVSPRLFVLVS
jgi:hypothetical protein